MNRSIVSAAKPGRAYPRPAPQGHDPSPCTIVLIGDAGDASPAGRIARIDRAVAAAAGCPVLVACGDACRAVALWASVAGDRAARVTGALLVSPVDDPSDGEDQPAPRGAMPFPSIVIVPPEDGGASRLRALATAWSAELRRSDRATGLAQDIASGRFEDGDDLVGELLARARSRWRRPRDRRPDRRW